MLPEHDPIDLGDHHLDGLPLRRGLAVVEHPRAVPLHPDPADGSGLLHQPVQDPVIGGHPDEIRQQPRRLAVGM